MLFISDGEKMFESKLGRWIFLISRALFLSIVAIGFCLFTVFLAWILVSYIDKDKVPQTFKMSVTKTVQTGGLVEIRIFDIYNYKLCPYRRNVSIVDSYHRRWDYDEISRTPPYNEIGPVPDLIIPIKLPEGISYGPATLKFFISYVCNGNFFQMQSPITKLYTDTFDIVGSINNDNNNK